MKASLLFYEKLIVEDGSVVEMKIWRVLKTPHYPLGVRYSLFWVKEGKILVGYDNHFPKGPHRHWGEREEEYEWVSVEKLIEDFKNDRERFKP